MNASMLMACLAASATLGQNSELVSKSPRIEIRTEAHDGKTFSYLLYNRIYMGRQYHNSELQPGLSRLATTYYHDKGPIGLVLTDAKLFPKKAEPPVLVLGMEVGTLAAYAQPGQIFHFTERVPDFVKLSQPGKGEKPRFTFVQEAIDRGAKVKIFEGEPRAMVEKHAADKFYQVIAIEACKVPDAEIHKELLTREALQLLMTKVTDDGLVCYHTSDRHYQLAPIIASAARELGFASLVGRYMGSRDGPDNDFRYSSEWVMVARAEKHLDRLKNDERNNAKDGELVDWLEPSHHHFAGSKQIWTKVNKEFLWTDKGEQSFRGLYLSDPEIDKLHDSVWKVQGFLNDSAGIPNLRTYQLGQPVHNFIRAWSKASADRMNRGSPLVIHQESGVISKSPRIEVIDESRDGKTFSYLMYNGTYMGRQYHKSEGNADLPRLPTTYFHDKGPIGIVLKNPEWFPAKNAPPVLVLGTDIGTPAVYAKPGQDFHFTERVPALVKLSFPDKGKKRYFTFLQDAIDRGANVKVFEGEPREMLEKHGKDRFYKVIVVESYKLPVIELHKELMTKEGLQLLMSKLRDDGIIAFHTSNRYYQLSPVVASAAHDLKLAYVVGRDFEIRNTPGEDFRFSSEWVMIARDPKYLAHLKKDDRNDIDWGPAQQLVNRGGKVTVRQVKSEFLWTDKGEQSLRGLYRSDPRIDALQTPASNLVMFFYEAGVPVKLLMPTSNALRGAIGAWSQQSAAELNRGGPGYEEKNK